MYDRFKSSTELSEAAIQGIAARARIFSHFMCMEKTSDLTKTGASLWSPPVSFSFLYGILHLCL
jgi:hypothetical protein